MTVGNCAAGVLEALALHSGFNVIGTTVIPFVVQVPISSTAGAVFYTSQCGMDSQWKKVGDTIVDKGDLWVSLDGAGGDSEMKEWKGKNGKYPLTLFK